MLRLTLRWLLLDPWHEFLTLQKAFCGYEGLTEDEDAFDTKEALQQANGKALDQNPTNTRDCEKGTLHRRMRHYTMMITPRCRLVRSRCWMSVFASCSLKSCSIAIVIHVFGSILAQCRSKLALQAVSLISAMMFEHKRMMKVGIALVIRWPQGSVILPFLVSLIHITHNMEHPKVLSASNLAY